MPSWLGALLVAICVAAGAAAVLVVLAILWPYDDDHERRGPGL